MTKTFNTLLEDVKGLLEEENAHNVDENNLEDFLSSIKSIVTERLLGENKERDASLRVSMLGTPNRKLWFTFAEDKKGSVARSLDYATKLKFAYGDIIESLLILLMKEAGHSVTGEQGEVDISGVKGHRDCIVDGITSDIKSASRFGFAKFDKATLFKDDPFGYIAQLSSYSKCDNSPYGAFIAINKESGEISVLKLHQVDMIDPESRVDEVRSVISLTSPPSEKCYEPVEEGTSGNLVLNSSCTYCRFRNECWKDANNGTGLRKFKYSNGVKEFVRVVKEPRVEEILPDDNDVTVPQSTT